MVGPEQSKANLAKIRELVMDPNKKMMVEFLGQMEGGRWLVRLQMKESQEDLSKFLVDRKLCVGVADPPHSFPEEEVVGPLVPRGELPDTGLWAAGVCFYVAPDKFYICPRDALQLYTEIRASCQTSPPAGRVQPVLGTCCLARHGEEFFRAEITQVSQDQLTVSVFLLDYGKSGVLVEVYCGNCPSNHCGTTPGSPHYTPSSSTSRGAGEITVAAAAAAGPQQGR